MTRAGCGCAPNRHSRADLSRRKHCSYTDQPVEKAMGTLGFLACSVRIFAGWPQVSRFRRPYRMR